MLPERTTTIGEEESVKMDSPFHIYHQVSDLDKRDGDALGRTMNAVEMMRPKLRSCAAACRGFPKLDSILAFEAIACTLFGAAGNSSSWSC